MDSPHDLFVRCSRWRHASAHELDDKGHEVERDEGECEGRCLDAEETVRGDVVVYHPREEHVNEGIDP